MMDLMNTTPESLGQGLILNDTALQIDAQKDRFQGAEVSEAFLAFFIPFSWIQSASGFIGSLSVLIVITRQHRITNHNAFIANMALTDMIILGYYWPFFAVDLTVGHAVVPFISLCVFNGIVIFTVTSVYVAMLIFVSVNRFMHICQFDKYHTKFSRNRVKLYILLSWMVSLVLSTVPFIIGPFPYWYKAETRVCTLNTGRSIIEITLNMLYVSVPLVFIGIVNFKIYRFYEKANVNTADLFIKVNDTIGTPQPSSNIISVCEKSESISTDLNAADKRVMPVSNFEENLTNGTLTNTSAIPEMVGSAVEPPVPARFISPNHKSTEPPSLLRKSSSYVDNYHPQEEEWKSRVGKEPANKSSLASKVKESKRKTPVKKKNYKPINLNQLQKTIINLEYMEIQKDATVTSGDKTRLVSPNNQLEGKANKSASRQDKENNTNHLTKETKRASGKTRPFLDKKFTDSKHNKQRLSVDISATERENVPIVAQTNTFPVSHPPTYKKQSEDIPTTKTLCSLIKDTFPASDLPIDSKQMVTSPTLSPDQLVLPSSIYFPFNHSSFGQQPLPDNDNELKIFSFIAPTQTDKSTERQTIQSAKDVKQSPSAETDEAPQSGKESPGSCSSPPPEALLPVETKKTQSQEFTQRTRRKYKTSLPSQSSMLSLRNSKETVQKGKVKNWRQFKTGKQLLKTDASALPCGWQRLERMKVREIRLFRYLMAVFITTCISLVPYGVVYIIEGFTSVSSEWQIAANVVLYLDNSCNWMLYGILNPLLKRKYSHFYKKVKDYVTSRSQCVMRRRRQQEIRD